MDAQSSRWSTFTTRLFAQNQFAIKLGLDSMNRALRVSGHDTLSHKVVLIAGTNGKGTLASSMASLLSASGLKVGLYTSPHIRDFTERFRIDGSVVPRQDVCEVGEQILSQFAHPDADPCLTFFELTTLMAVHLFERHEVDVAIYEVGLGGRLDATNALNPDLCVLGTVGYDHQQYLGDTLDDIVNEKLGILRDDVPLFVSGQEHAQVHRRLTTLRHTPLYVYQRNLGLRSHFDQSLLATHEAEPSEAADRLWWYCAGTRRELDIPRWGHFVAPYQHRHLVTALSAADYLSTALMRRSPELILGNAAHTIATMRWPGRLHYITPGASSRWHGIEFLCDAAHNVDGVRALMTYMQEVDYMPDVICFSALKDKEIEPMLSCLHPALSHRSERECHTRVKLVTLSNPRAAEADTLGAMARRALPDLEAATAGLETSLDEIMSSRGEGSLTTKVLVCGSIYLLGELFDLLEHDEASLNLEGL